MLSVLVFPLVAARVRATAPAAATASSAQEAKDSEAW
jgi:hypothetical protein